MKMFLISVRDRAADVFGQPRCVMSLGAAIRSFSDEVNREAPDNDFYNHPEDFDLYELGEFDDGAADFALLPKPRQICIGKDVSKAVSKVRAVKQG